MKQLKDINGRLRTCTRCKSGAPAVFKKSGEWLCEECLAKRKARQAADAAKPKCHKCNGQAMHGEIWCNNHAPEFDPVAELERLEKELAEVREEYGHKCAKCGSVLQLVRPGKHQCQYCEMESALTAELARYKQGVEVEDFVNRYGVLEAEYELRPELWGKRVRVLVMKVEE